MPRICVIWSVGEPGLGAGVIEARKRERTNRREHNPNPGIILTKAKRYTRLSNVWQSQR